MREGCNISRNIEEADTRQGSTATSPNQDRPVLLMLMTNLGINWQQLCRLDTLGFRAADTGWNIVTEVSLAALQLLIYRN